MTSAESWTVTTDGPDRTRALAALLGRRCRGGEVLLLAGDLGAGKTTFVQGLAAGLGVDETEPVTSPTFVLHCRYRGRLGLEHIDAYRLIDAPAAPGELGFDELFGAPESVCAVEWPAGLGELPRAHLGVHLRVDGPHARTVRFTPLGPSHRALVAELRQAYRMPSG